MKFLIRLLIPAISVLIIAYLLPTVSVDSFADAILVSVVIGVLNLLVKPILELISLPITILSLGLFMLVINGVIILATDHLLAGFSVDGFLTAILFSLILSVLSSLLENFLD